jgi:isopenicillin N synthase-like dioxygenase
MDVIPASRRLDTSEVPVVDIGPLVRGDESGLTATVDALAAACADTGFMYVKNHGVPSTIRDELVRQCALFFDLPVEEKMAVGTHNSEFFRGFLPVKYKGATSAGENMQEGFIVFHDRPISDASPMYGPNQWPANPPGFRAAMENYFSAAEKLAHAMLPGFALALGLDRNFFSPIFSDPLLMLKLNHYPPQPKPEEGLEMGVRGHSDSGGFTILWQDNVGGLELQTKTGEWIGVPPIPDTYVINIGDMMQVWTNQRFKSTKHRVINTYGVNRYSIPLFVNPNYHTMVRPLVGEVDPEFKPFMSGDYHYAVYRRIYPQKTP